MMPTLKTTEAEMLRQSEVSHAINFAFAFVVLFAFSAVAFGLTGLMVSVSPAVLQWCILGIIAVGGFTVSGILFIGWRRGHRHISKIVGEFIEWSQLEREIEENKYFPAAPAAPALPAVTSGVPEPILIGGFDKADLRALCFAFANGSKWTEDAMLGKELPVTGEALSRERYNELMRLFVEKGIIAGRGGPGNATGKLTLRDAMQMFRILVNESPALSPSASPKTP